MFILRADQNSHPSPRPKNFTENADRHLGYLTYVLLATAAVYLISRGTALTNPYLVNDDVRQQIYWMQQWTHPELFQHDILTQYARNYVPWGVQAVYWLASPWINPVQFTKVVGGILYVATGGFLYGLGISCRDRLAAVFMVCIYCLSAPMMNILSGGLAQSFGLPILAGYLFFLSRENFWGGGVIILLASLLNPYIFALCCATHGIILFYQLSTTVIAQAKTPDGPDLRQLTDKKNIQVGGKDQSYIRLSLPPSNRFSLTSRQRTMLGSLLPIILGLGLLILKYQFNSPAGLGKLVTLADMTGKIEYTAAGRYEIIPVPSFVFELIRPWHTFLGNFVVVPIILFIGAAFLAFTWRSTVAIQVAPFKVFIYLGIASWLMHNLADLFLMQLFLPRRYVEFPWYIFNCVALGLIARIILGKKFPQTKQLIALSLALFVIASVAMWHVGIYDYSGQKNLYNFLESTPPSSLMAGNPEVMDNVVTFARRKALVTYELSHTWYKGYWQIIRERTYDFFQAYYAAEPSLIQNFCRKYQIDFLIVRDQDFSKEYLSHSPLHFEPFDSYIRQYVKGRSKFALLDRGEFPPIYEQDGLRVVPMRSTAAPLR